MSKSMDKRIQMQKEQDAGGIERTTTKKGRYYKRPQRDIPPAAKLVPLTLDTLKAVLAGGNGESPSVTTVLNALAKPALIGWAAKEERKLISLLAGELYERLYLLVDEPVPKEKFVEILLEEAGKQAHRKLLTEAAHVGTEVHHRIEWQLKGETNRTRDPEPPALTTPEAARSWERWLEWRQQVNLEVIDIEKRVYSALFGFGGAIDLLAKVNGKLMVGDFKTSRKVYSESFLQNVAYRLALREEGIDAEQGYIIRLPKYAEDPEFEVVEVPEARPLEIAFLSLAVVYKWWAAQKPPKDSVPASAPIPDVGA